MKHIDDGIVLIIVFAQVGAFEHPGNGLAQGLFVTAENGVCSPPAARVNRSAQLLTGEAFEPGFEGETRAEYITTNSL